MCLDSQLPFHASNVGLSPARHQIASDTLLKSLRSLIKVSLILSLRNRFFLCRYLLNSCQRPSSPSTFRCMRGCPDFSAYHVACPQRRSARATKTQNKRLSLTPVSLLLHGTPRPSLICERADTVQPSNACLTQSAASLNYRMPAYRSSLSAACLLTMNPRDS